MNEANQTLMHIILSNISLQNLLSIIAIAVSIFTFYIGLFSKKESDKQAKEQDDIKNILAQQANHLKEQSNEQAILKNELAEQANKLTLMLSGKEHEMSENLKYETLELVSVIKAIDSKIDYNDDNDYMLDYSHEIETLRSFQLRPSYLLLLKAIDYNRDKSRIDILIHHITSSTIPEHEIRRFCQEILITVSRLNLDDVIKQIRENYNNNWNEMVKEVCLLSRYSYNKKTIGFRLDEAFYFYLKEDKGLTLPDLNKWDADYTVRIKEAVRPYYANNANSFIADNPNYNEYQRFIGAHLTSFVKYLIITGKYKEPIPEEIVKEIKKGQPLSDEVNAYIDTMACIYVGRSMSLEELFSKYADEYDCFIFHQMLEKQNKK